MGWDNRISLMRLGMLSSWPGAQPAGSVTDVGPLEMARRASHKASHWAERETKAWTPDAAQALKWFPENQGLRRSHLFYLPKFKHCFRSPTHRTIQV